MPKKQVRILICSRNSIDNTKIAEFLFKKGYQVQACIGLQNLQKYRNYNPHVTILCAALKDHVWPGDVLERMEYAIQALPNTHFIACDERHIGQNYATAGRKLNHEILFHTLDIVIPESNQYIDGLHNHDERIDPKTGKVLPPIAGGFCYMDTKLLEEQIAMCIREIQTDTKQLEEEKAQFYNAVQEMFLQRSTITADISKEISFIEGQFKRFRVHKALDMGRGLGRLTIPLAQHGYEMYGIDITEGLLKKAKDEAQKHNLNIVFEQRNALQTQYPDQSFDAVLVMWHTICELHEHRIKLLHEAARVLHPGGPLIFDFPDISKNKHIPKTGEYKDSTPFGEYASKVPQLKEMLTELNSAGLTDIIYKKVNWGMPKFIIIARGYGLTW